MGRKAIARLADKRAADENEVVSDMEPQASEDVAQAVSTEAAPMLLAQASGAPAGVSGDGAAAAAATSAQAQGGAGVSAVGASGSGNLLWVGLGAVGLAAAAGGGGSDAPPPPRYALIADKTNVDESGVVTFTLTDRSKAAGESFDYVISGVQAADVVGGALTGRAVIGADGKAEISVQLVADRATEGVETVTLAVAGQSQSVAVNDTSLSPTFTLSKSADAVDEGQAAVFTLQTTNVDAGATYDYVITGVQAADVVGGVLTGRAVIGADGKAEISVQLVADRVTEGAETVTLAVAGQSQSVSVNDTSLSPTFTLSKSADAVDEGHAAVFTLQTTNVDAGAAYDYVITGVQAADVVGGVLTGRAVIGVDGKAEISVQLVADRVTEGAETLSLTVAGQSQSVAVTDTSVNPTYTLAKSADAVDEGGMAVFTLQTTNVDAGATYDYVITGVQAADVVGGLLTGTAVIGADGKAEVRVQLVADRVTEGAETVTLAVAGQNQSVVVNDTSLSPTYTLSKSAAAVDEGQTAVFTLQTTNVDAGATFDYVITGVQAADVVGGLLTGTAVIGADGKAEIRVQLVADRVTEGAETVTLAVAGQSQSVVVNDTSTDPVFNLTLAQDDFTGENKGTADDNLYIGRVSTDEAVTTYTEGDRIDGGEGSNTLRVFMDPGTVADGVDVQNIQTLDLRLNAATSSGSSDAPMLMVSVPVYASTLVMSDWDASLQQMNIRSNKSNLVVLEQQSIADIAIVDGSTADLASSYAFVDYAAGVLDGAADHLNLSVNNVNGEDGSDVVIDDAMESLSIDVADRAGAQYASDIDLIAGGVEDITITGGRTGQRMTLEAIVAAGATLTSSAFAGDLHLTSSDIKTATLGAGNDVLEVTGQADLADASYDLGEGDNEFTYGGTLGGVVLAGAGDDQVSVGATGEDSSIAVGDGNNTVTVTGEHAGAIVGGAGDDTVTAASTAAGSSIDVGDGSNTVTVTGEHAGAIVGGAGVDTVSVGSTAAGSTVNVGEGNNSFTVAGEHAGGFEAGSGDDTVSVATTAADSTIALGDGHNHVFATGEHAGEITAGSGEDMVVVGDKDALANVVGSISTGDGTDDVIVWGNVDDGSIDVGGGDSNYVFVSGSVIATDPGTITFGDGDENFLGIGENLDGDDVVFGHGADNYFAIGGNVQNGASISLGNGDNAGTIQGAVTGGSTVTFGSGADELVLSAWGLPASPEVLGTDVATVINMGGSDDHVILQARSDEPTDLLVRSGGFIEGGDGNDTLTLVTEQTVEGLIGRTELQQATIDLGAAPFAVGDDITVTFTRGDEVITVTITADELQQGPENLAATVAAALADAINDELGDAAAIFGAAVDGSVITLTSDNVQEDYAIAWQVNDSASIDATVVQISDARITSFETLELVALDSAGEDYISIGADFDLIDGTHTIMLDSQVDRDVNVVDSSLNGTYTTYADGGMTTYNLSNLKGGEAMHVAGHEASASGNSQVSQITVGNVVDDHRVGDKIVVTIAGETVTYTVTESDLAAETEALDAINIATGLAAAIEQAGITVARDDNVLTLVGEPGVGVAIEVNHVRESQTVIGSYTGGSEGSAYGLLPYMNWLAVGDVIAVDVFGDGGEFSYTIQAADLAPLCGRSQAEVISEAIVNAANAAGVEGFTAQWGTVNFDGGFTATVTRVTDILTGDAEKTTVSVVQDASDTDDRWADVEINATLADGAANTTMDLTVAGYGNFDVDILGSSGYEALNLKLGDAHSHIVDTYGDEGNFANSITVSDVADVNTAGQQIGLDAVLAHTVDTSASKANFTIDQLSVRGEDVASFEDEVITVTTGTGDDHLITLAQSAMAEGSSIDLGEGSNTLSLGWGEDVTVTSTDLEAVDGIQYSGNLAQLDILNDVLLDQDSTTMAIPGDGETGKLTFTDLGSSKGLAADLTITGASDDLVLESASGFELGATGGEDSVVGTLTATRRDGTPIGGDLSVTAVNHIVFNLGNAALAGLTVAAADGRAEVFIAGNGSDAEFVLGEVAISSGSDWDEDLDDGLNIIDNTGASVTIASLALNGDEDVDLAIAGNTGLNAVIGDVTITSNNDADVQVDGNSDSSITLGAVSITGDGDSTNELVYEFNTDTSMTVASVDIVGTDRARLDVHANTESSFTVAGDIRLSGGGDDAILKVDQNTRTNVSLSVDGTIALASCASDATLNIDDNWNDYDPFEVGPDQGALLSRTFTVAAGDVVMDAGRHAEVSINTNIDDTYFGDLVVSLGDVTMQAYDEGVLDVRYNYATTITLDDVSIRSRGDASVRLDDNDGVIYKAVGGVTDRDEADYAEISMASVTVQSDQQAYMGIGDHDTAARVTVGAVQLSGVSSAGFEVVSNNGTPDVDDNIAASLMDIHVGDVTVKADGLAGVSIGWNFSGEIEPTGDKHSGGNSNAAVELGNVTIESTDVSDAEAGLVIANNLGEDGRGSVTLGDVEMTSAVSGGFSIRDNALGGGDDAGFVGLEVGDVTMTSAVNAQLAIEANTGSDTNTVMSFGAVALTAASTEDATEGYAALGFANNTDVDATFKGVTLTGVSTGLFVNDNSESSVDLGDVVLVSEGADGNGAALTVNDNLGSTVTMASVDIDSAADALFEMTINSDSTVDIGNVTIDADQAAEFMVTESDADVTMGDVTITANSVGDFTSARDDLQESVGFQVLTVGGSDASVELQDVTITAQGSSDSDVSAAFVAYGDGSQIVVGDVTVEADRDVFFYIESGEDSLGVTAGDISITSGVAADGMSDGDADFSSQIAVEMLGVSGTESVTLTANVHNMVGGEDLGHGGIYAAFTDAYDLKTVTASGTDAEMYFKGSIGSASDAEGDFTLDLSGMTGSFEGSDDGSGYSPSGSGDNPYLEADRGTYVVNVDANFGDNQVVVKVGSGDLIYNAQHSDFGMMDGSDASNWYYAPVSDSGVDWQADWFGEEGWYSLGEGLDLQPERQVTTLTAPSVGSAGISGEDDAYYDIDLTINGVAYDITLRIDDNVGLNDYDGWNWDLGAIDSADGETTAAEALAALGIQTNINVDGYWDWQDLILTGPADGSAFTASTSNVVKTSGDSGNLTVTIGNDTTAGGLPTDGLGNQASEVFAFVGESIGDVVIGGFRPNGVGLFAESEVDRLDFSMLLDIQSADDLRITVEEGGGLGDANGYFDDVIIDFVNESYGSVRLVGVGEYFTDANVNGIANSIIFA